MPTLKEKSTISISSAYVLTQKEETCLSSVHCAYYSCYQRILYYLDNAFSYSDAKRKTEYDNYLRTFSGSGKRLGSHEYWIFQFTELLKKAGYALNSIQIDKNIKVLKEARTEADYQESDFSKKQTDGLYDKALETIKYIDKSF